MDVKPRAASGALALVLALGGTFGCSAAPTEQEAQGWTEPAWFAEQAQMREERETQLEACLGRLGWDVAVDAYGGVEEPFSTKAELTRFAADAETCHVQVVPEEERSYRPTEEDYRRAYGRDLDTWACLVSEGMALEPPPSEEVYVERFLAADVDMEAAAHLWFPYGDVAFQDPDLTWTRQQELRELCPERWGVR